MTKIEFKIKMKDGEIWKKWVAEHIGFQGVDWFHEAVKHEVYDDDGENIGYYYDHYINIPDDKKALLWIMRWGWS